MQNVIFHIVRALLTVVAWLPLPILYVFSSAFFYLIYYIVRYRRGVVDDNLAQCFPDMPEQERHAIRKQFYRNFADYIVETVKLFHISDKEMCRRMEFRNIELIDDLTAQGKSIVVYFAHCGNWEWAPSMTLHVTPNPKVDYCQVYRPLKSKVFDRIMLCARSRFGSLSFPKQTVFRSLLMLKKEGRLSVTGFMSDQKPSHGDPTVVTRFLGRPTAFISGTETVARRMDMAVIYWDTEKISRGHYRITCRLIDDGTIQNRPSGDITRQYAQLLEETIMRNPAIWLWTHKRWKIPVILTDGQL